MVSVLGRILGLDYCTDGLDLMLSVLIPCFKGSNLLEPLIEKVSNDPYKDKEIFVVIDEPNKKSKKLPRRFKNVHFFFNKKRLGKSTALNLTAKEAKGEILLFLDSDIRINTDNFLEKVVKSMDNTDIIDFKIDTINNSFFSKVVNYDYMTMGLYEHFFSGVKKSIGVNGAAFALKKDFFESVGGLKNVLLEDWEIGFQSYLNNKTYKHVEDISISTKVPSFLKKWMSQRKRWGLGAGIQCRNHWRDMLKVLAKYPKISLLSLLFFFPMAITFLFSFSLVEDAFFLSLMLLTFKIPALFPLLFFASWSILLLKNAFMFFIAYTITSIIYYVTCKKLQFNYRNRDFFCYYLLYSPLWMSLFVYNFVKGFAYRRIGINIANWKF